jgi:CRISPR/Cas system endoribonuclease Cas6 (RAMP superfamily)
MDSTTRQATASKQLDIFFKENVFFISGGIPLFLRHFLTNVNNLQLINSIGGNIITKKISSRTWLEITQLFTDITPKVSRTILSIARRVKSLPFVTDVR